MLHYYFSKLKKLDFPTIIFMVCLITIGTIAINGATSETRLNGLYISNLVLFAVFCLPMLLVAVFDYKLLMGKLAYVLYGIGIALLLLVKFKGENINGAVRWISIGGQQLQPSELVKLFTILLVAYLLQKRAGQPLRLFQDLLPICIVFLIPTVLIMQQPDLGTSLVFIGILIGMVWMGNMRMIYFVICIGIVALVVGLILWLYYADYELLAKIVKPHQMERIQTFLDPVNDPDKSWHITNAMNAIASGGIIGDNGYYLQQGYIPYAYSDSIFVVIGEKYGFVGSAVLLLLYLFLVYRLVMIVVQSKELGGSYLVVGLIGMLVFQIFVNIGMHIGLVPLTGISLPFISYGGSSLLTNMIAIGLALSVNIHQDEIELSA
ncbi:rod shape-determining protein RodA [Paenibacillus albiflavus]|uniref:Rod shape-determining protein RodA n=1 Tax=Paenibacillus albiflavus TaxID=2545760 RepID=A0A4R4EM27_9BACL|nr:FtsW/RodA/SpoVE family cell cycle protein [Paenibacillus albiflavus]TCZ80847.1 rod shape-determining protein RodA [Paenibacillus albiflavus]